MHTSFTDALSPLDGRYGGKLTEVRQIFSEAGLMRERVRVECAWFLALAAGPGKEMLRDLPEAARQLLAALASDPQGTDVPSIKKIEARTNHDVKAVEYWLRGELKSRGASAADLEWMHFACTSEDINNLAYALMLKTARATLLLPMLADLGAKIDALAARHAGVGNFNAHVAALPHVDWPAFSAAFVESLGLQSNAYTTQIEPHDWIAEYCHALMRANTVLLDLARDMWSYISLGYFKQRMIEGEVGSSTMPHKVNPIDFENAEGNLGLANALLGHFADKLPVSRMQRDLTDSTVLRNVGVAIGHSVLSYGSLERGLDKIELDQRRVAEDLDRAWEVLGEAVQTVMRAHGIPDAYDRLKSFTRGRPIDRVAMHEFIDSLELPPAEKQRLLQLEPATYVGLAPLLAKRTHGPYET